MSCVELYGLRSSEAAAAAPAADVPAAGTKRKRDSDEASTPEMDAACEADIQQWEAAGPRPTVTALEQMEIWREETERFGMFEVMQCTQALINRVAENLRNSYDNPAYGEEWKCDGVDEFGQEHCSLGDSCHLMLLPLDPLYRRQFLTEAMPPLKLEDVVQVPYVYAPAELKTVREHVENRRRQVFTQRKMQRTAGQFTENQRRLREANTPQLFHDLMRQRTREIFSALKPNYLASRVSVLRIWIGMVIEGFGEPGLRSHWPEDRGDDHIMNTFLTMMSMRCVTWAAVSQAFTHVIEGHFMMFAVPPPEFKVARWTLAKLKKVMAKERPSGRKIRPGLDVEATDSICKVLFDCLGRPPYKSTPVTRMYVNIGAAIAFTFEKALRAGETCPGEAFDPKDHLSRQTIGAVLQPAASLQTGDVQAVVIQPPLRKTSFASEAARQKASAPLVFDAKSKKFYSFCRWGPLLQEIDPAPRSEWPRTPAFRLGGKFSAALSGDNLRAGLRKVAQDVIHNWEDFEYGNHSLRIGRNNSWRAAQAGRLVDVAAADAQLNRATTHTTSAGRAPYDRESVAESLALDRAAESVRIVPVETLHKYSEDRSAVHPGIFVKMSSDIQTEQAINPFRPCANSECDLPANDAPCTKHDGRLMQCCSLKCHQVAKRTAAYAQKHVAAIEDKRITEAELTETEAYEAGESELIAFGGDDSEEEERRVTQARPAKAVPRAAPRVPLLCHQTILCPAPLPLDDSGTSREHATVSA